MNESAAPKSANRESDAFTFNVDHTCGEARACTLTTPHGEIQTPIFMPVGTAGSVKALAPDDISATGAQIILGNTYHLMLRPGPERLERLGGLHKFMRWNGPILTDSGGFQVFSLASQGKRGVKAQGAAGASGGKEALVTIDDEGVTFKSHLDGTRYRMTPEESMRVQMCIGADIIMAFDQCPPGSATREQVQHAMDRTTAWLDRCITAMDRPRSRLFGITQGGIFDDLRAAHVEEICQRDLFGFAIGGLSVGEAKEDMVRVLTNVTPRLPAQKPRYLMGVGTPEDLLDGVERGVDMFDCVMPTRNARTATLFTTRGKLTIKNAAYAEDERPVDSTCSCYTCTTFTRAYLRHLFRAGELLFYRLASLHNVTHYLSLMKGARQAIVDGRFTAFANDRREAYKLGPDTFDT